MLDRTLRLFASALLATSLCASAAAQSTNPAEASHADDFQSYGTQKNPPGWVDSSVGRPAPAANGLFKTWPDPLQGNHASNIVYGTKQASGQPDGNTPRIGTFSTLTSKSFNGKGRFEYRGRLLRTSSSGRIGLTFFSSYPERDSYYLIGLWSHAGSSTLTMQLFAFGGGAPAGTLDSNFTPQPNVWYQFRIQAGDASGKTTMRARFWADGTAEPQQWSIDAADPAAGRLTSGRIGFWAAAAGDEYVDDLSAKSPVDNAPPSISFFDVDAQKTLDASALALFRTPARIEVRGTDDTSTPVVTATLDGAPYTSGSAIAVDGEHTLIGHATDGSGNTADATLHLFVDQVPPSVTVLGNDSPLTDGQIFPETVKITADVRDATSPASTITTTGSLGGAPAVLLPLFAVEEKLLHTVEVRAVDRTGNETTVTRTFTVDRTAPVVVVTANGRVLGTTDSFQTNVTLDWTVTDLTLDSVVATLDDAPVAKGAVVTTEQLHHLVIVAKDKATHTTTFDSKFALEKNAPQVTLLANDAPFVAGKSYPEPVRLTLDIHSATTPTVDIKVDGAVYTLDTPITVEKLHTVEVTVTNGAQLQTKIGPSNFFVDTTPPSLSLTESGTPFTDLRPFNRDVVPVVTATDNLTASPKITLLVDNVVAEPGVAITAEKAEHTIEATAVDDAGNSARVGPFRFVLDKTKPVVAILDAATNAPFSADALFRVPVVVKVVVTDLTKPTLDATLDGSSLAFTPAPPSNDGTFVFTSAPIAGDRLHQLSVVAADAVQNTSAAVTAQFTIDTIPPPLAITAPPANATVGTPTILVLGTCGDAVRVVVAGREALVDTTAQTFAASDVPLLEGRNDLLVEAFDKAGNRGSVTLTVFLDTRAPELAITSPHANECLNAATIALAGTVGDAGTADVRVSDGTREVAATVASDGTWTASLPVTNDGRVTLTVTARDAAGHEVTSALPLTIDRTRPVVAVTSSGAPFHGGVVARPVALFVSAADDDPAATLTLALDGAPYTSGATVSAEGSHTLVASARDCAGNISDVATIVFTIDTIAPHFAALDPAEGSTIPTLAHAISGTVDTDDVVQLSLDGLANAAVHNGRAFTFNGVPLVEGVNRFTLVAVDAAGNTTRLPYSFRVKSTAPPVEITESGAPLAPDALFNRAVTPVIRSAEPDATIAAKLGSADFVSGTTITADGSYTLTATATDAYQHTSAPATATFTIDRTPPPVAIESVDGATVTADHVAVRVTTDTDVVRVTVNGLAAALGANNVYTATVPLELGPNAIVAVAVDRAGNSGSAQLDVTRGRDRAGIVLTSPANGTFTNRRTIAVTGQLLAPLGASVVTINGTEVAVDAAGAFHRNDVAVASGDNTITATVRPNGGTPSDVTVHVTGDFQPPVVHVLAGTSELADGAHFTTAPQLSIGVTDENPDVLSTFTVDGNVVAGTTAPALADGGHTVTVVATDRAGNQTRVDRTLAIGAGGGAGTCAITALDPPSNTAVAGSTVRITGRTGGATAVVVNGNAAQLAAGSFAADVALQPGANDIAIACDGGETTHLTLFRYDDATIAITSPHEDEVLAASSVTVSGTVAAGVVSGDVNGKPFTVSNGTFSVAGVDLAAGINILAAHAKTSSSRTAVATVRVKHFAPPALAITSPLDGAQTGAATIDVTGTFANVDPSTIAAAGLTATTTTLGDTAGTFRFAALPLASGANAIAVTARGRDGSTVTATVDVQRVDGAPSVSIDSPKDGASIAASATQLAVSGTVAPVSGTQLQVNGTAATIDAAGHFTATLDLSGTAAGLLPVVARASSGDSGKSATDTIVVTRLASTLSVRRPFPAQNAADVDPGVAVVLLFTSAVDPSTVANAIQLRDAAGAAVPVRTFVDRDAVTLAPLAPLTAGMAYTATVATSLLDLAGGALDAPYSLPFAVASTAPLAMPDVDPIAGGCITTAKLTGRVATPGAVVRLDLDGVQSRTTASAAGAFSFDLRFSGLSGFHVARVRQVGSDGSLSPERAVSFRIDCDTPHVVSASLDRAAQSLAINFSKPMNGATLVASAAGSIVVSLDGAAALDRPVTLNPAGDVATIALGIDVAAKSVALTVRTIAEDTTAAHLSTEYTQTFLAASAQPSGGYVSGAVYDATNGRPLANVRLDFGGATPAAVTDARGRYATATLPEGAYTLEASADGYTRVWRQVVVPPGTGVVPIDIRLTLRGAAQTAATSALTLEHGGDTAVTKKTTLTIPAASLAAGRKVRLTAVGAQSLPGLLPLGWSPAAAAEIAIDDSPLPQPLAGSRLTFDLSADAAALAATGQTLSLVAYDRERDEWRVVLPVVTPNGAATAVDITTAGNFALVYPDRAPQLAQPSAAHAGAALGGVANPCSTAPCALTKRAFNFTPPSIPPSGRAMGVLVLEGASAFPSGTALQAVIDEQLNLADGTTLVDPPFATDLLVYRNLAGDAGIASFHLAPTARAKSVTLRDGVDHVRVVEYPGRVDRGALIGADGGRVAGDDSVSIDIPAGATTEALHASVVSIPASELAQLSVAGFRVAGGFTFSLTRAQTSAQPDLDGDGQPDAQPAPVLQLPAKATFAVTGAAAQAVVAELLPSTSYGSLIRLAARAAVTTSPIDIPNAKLFTTRTESALPVEGIVRDGRYLILVPTQPIAFAYGQVVAGSSPLASAAVTSGTGSPFTVTLGVGDLTRRGGIFAVPVVAAPFSLQPRALAIGSGAIKPFDVAAVEEVRNVGVLPLAAQAPRLHAIVPDNATIDATASFTAQATFEDAIDAATTSGIVVTNLATNATLAGTVSAAGAIVTFRATAPLLPATRYSITVLPSIRGANGAPFGRAVTALFSTRAVAENDHTIHPELIHITIPNANGVATITGAANGIPAGAIAIAVRRGHVFLEQYQQTAQANQPFAFAIGGGSPSDAVTIRDAIDLQVVDGTSHSILATLPLTPFVTADGTGFVARPDVATKFTSASGITVTVPAGAFDEPTLVTVAADTADAFAAVPSFSQELRFAAGMKLTFAGTAQKPLDVELPATNLDPATSYYLGLLGQSIRGPRVMIVDLLRIDGSKLTTADAATTANAVLGKARVSSNTLSRGEQRRLLLNVTRAGEYAAVAFVNPVAFVSVAATSTAPYDYFVDTLSSMYVASFYLAERGRAIVPVAANLPFHIVAVDAQTGVSTVSQTFAALPPNEPDGSATIVSPVADEYGPYPVFASPSRLEVIDLAVDEMEDESHRNFVVAFNGTTVTLRKGADALPEKTRVELLDLRTLASSSVADFANAPAPLTLAARRGDRLLLFVGSHDVDPDSTITVAFNRPIETSTDPAVMRKRFTLLSSDTAEGPYTPIDGLTNFDVASNGRVVRIALAGSIPRGKFYRLALSPDIEEKVVVPLQPLKLAQHRDGPALSAPLTLDFSTREPAGVVGTFNLTSGSVRDLAMSGNVLFVSALDGGVVAYDASDPAKLATATPIGRIAPPLGTTDADGSAIPGQNWAVAVDQHGRLYATALSGFFGVLRSYRVEDFLKGSTQPVAQKSNAIITWRPGSSVAVPTGTSDPAVTDRAEGIPRKLRLITQDDEPETYATFGLLRDAFRGTNPVDLGGGYSKSTLHIPGFRAFAYLTQRVTIVNTTSRFRWSVDVPRNGEATLNVIGKATDAFQVIRNAKTYGVVSIFGYGIGVYDLNAIESNRIQPGDPAFDAAYVPAAERVLLDDAAPGGECSAEGAPCDPALAAQSGQHCPIGNLNFSPEAALAANGTQLVVWAVDANRGLLELRVDPPARQNDGTVLPAACTRSNSLVLADRVPTAQGIVPFAHPRLNTLRDLFVAKHQREPLWRFTSIATFTVTRKVDGVDQSTLYGLIAGLEYGLIAVKLDPARAIDDQSVVGLVWIENGAYSVRVLEGAKPLATVVDGAGHVLLVDLSRIDESAAVPDAPGPCVSTHCAWPLFPTAAAAITAGVDDPRVLWRSKDDPSGAPTVTGTLPPLVDPDSGFVFTGDVNGTKLRVVSAVDPQLRFIGDLGLDNTDSKELTGIVPLGIKPRAGSVGTTPNASAAAFRLELSLPASVIESLPAHALKLAVESERVPGALAPESPTGFVAAHLHGDTAITLDRVVPDSQDVDVRLLRYQRGFNRLVSPWIVAIADPRASVRYTEPVPNAREGCDPCTRPQSLQGRSDVLELFTAGRSIAVHPEAALSFGTDYAYLGEKDRLLRRVPTVMADTIQIPSLTPAAQAPPIATGMLQETTYLHSGELAVGAIDLDAGGRAGVNAVADREYRSRLIGGTALGRGWDSSLFTRLRQLPNGNVELRDGTGDVRTFELQSDGYHAPAGLFVTLTTDGRGWKLFDQKKNFAYFDEFGRLIARADAFANPSEVLTGGTSGSVVRYLYDASGRLSQIIDPENRITHVNYWAADATEDGAYPGLLEEIVDWRERKVSYRYDANGRLTKVLLPQVAAASGVPADYDFSTDARRPRTLYKYVTPPTDFTGSVDLGANLESIVDPAEALTTQTARVAFEYGTDVAKRDRVVKQTWGTGETASFDYQSPTHVQVTDALRQPTDYDLTSGPIVEIAKMSQVVPVVDFGSSLPERAPVGGAAVPAPLDTLFTYGQFGELRSITYPNGRIEAIVPTSVPGIPGTVTSTVMETGGTGHITSFEYDSNGEAPAVPVKVTQSETSAGGGTRPSQTPSRTHLKTATVDTGHTGVIGEEALYDAKGRLTNARTLAGAPVSGDTLSGNAVRETTYEYTADDEKTQVARGTLKTINVAGTKAITQTVGSAAAGGMQSRTTDDRRKVDAQTDTDANDRVVHSTVGSLLNESFGYDASGRLVYSSRTQSGATIVTKTEYDVVGRAIKTTLQNGANILGSEAPIVTTTTYRLADRVVERSDAHVDGQSFATTTTKLDGLGRAIETTRTGGGESITARFGYDRSGSRSFETDTVRSAVARRFDSRGREVESVDSIGVRQTSKWSAWDELTDSTTLDAAGQRIGASHQSYTALGRLRSSAEEMEPGGAARVSWLTWNDGATIVGTRVGRAASILTQLSGAARGTQQTLDNQGRVTDVASGAFTGINDLLAPANTFASTHVTDFDGDLPVTVESKEKLGGTVTSRISYDALGRATTTREGDTYTTTTAYDEAGNTTSITPPGMAPRSMQYDGRGLLLQETLQDGSTIRYSYDALGNLRERTDQSGEKTKYDVDALGRVTTVTYPDATTEVTRYEAASGAVRATKNRAGQWRSFVFDGRGAIAEVHNVEQASAGNVSTMIERRTYDAGGRLQLVANRDGAVEYTDLDLLGRPRLTRTYRYRNGSGLTTADVYDVHTQSHVWNEHGERTRWRMPAAGTTAGGSTTPTPWRTFIDETHDGGGNLTTMTTAATAIVTGIGRGVGRLGARSRALAGGDPLQSVYGYADGAGTQPPDAMTLPLTPDSGPATGLLRALETTRGNTRISSVNVAHDPARRIGAIVDSSFGGRGSSFHYDSRGRLASAQLSTDPRGSTASIVETMTAADFRSGRTAPSRLSASQHALLGNALSASLEAATWNATELAGHRLDVRTSSLDGSTVATTPYEFAGGRRTKEGDWSVVYDENDRLTSRTNTNLGRRITYVYDPNGRLIGRTAFKANGAEWVLENRSEVLAADFLPPDVTFVWDPITDRLVSISIAGASTPRSKRACCASTFTAIRPTTIPSKSRPRIR